MNTELVNLNEEKRLFRRVLSLIPEEDVVLFSMHDGNHFAAKLVDLSRGGALISTANPADCVEVGGPYKVYFQSCGQMFQIEGMLVRNDPQLLAFKFINVTILDITEIRSKLARMEMLAARLSQVQ